MRIGDRASWGLEGPELVCVLCGMIGMWENGSMSVPSKCAANAGGSHVRPDDPGPLAEPLDERATVLGQQNPSTR